ncbi:hypothetical protein [Staphylococcus arlettae]|uniref:hypothetical protein n=1 Tax=Staphylococcus arlettae TaxID=29378 RepID=UPI0021CED3CD|nr:hypothetical protein [Staphylococcus arlettae]UXU53176.1 hypothetical protein MUA71_03620 [Staphylococcus arlettae]
MSNQSKIKMTNDGFEVCNGIGEVIASISSDDGDIEIFNGKSKIDNEEIHAVKGGDLNLTSRGTSTYVIKPKNKKQIAKIVFNLTRLVVFIHLTIKGHKLSKKG